MKQNQVDDRPTKPKKPRASRATRKGARKKPAKTAEERTDRYIGGRAGSAEVINYNQITTRMGKLRAMLEPKTPELIEAMYEIAMDKKVHPSVRLEAADRLLTRLYGKPKETIELQDGGSVAGSDDEMTKLLNNILAKVDAPLLEASDVGAESERAASDE